MVATRVNSTSSITSPGRILPAGIAGRVDIGDQHALGVGIDAVAAARRGIECGQRHAENFIGTALGGD